MSFDIKIFQIIMGDTLVEQIEEFMVPKKALERKMVEQSDW